MSASKYGTQLFEFTFTFLFFLVSFTSFVLWPLQNIGISFYEFTLIFPVITLASLFLIFRFKLYLFRCSLMYSAPSSPHVKACTKSPLFGLALVTFTFVLVSILLKLDESFSYAWLLGAFGCSGLLFFTEQRIKVQELKTKEMPPAHVFALSVTSATLILLYLLSTATNADDTHFVSYIAGLLKHPDAPLFSVDVIFNQSLPNHIFSLNLGQSWELIVATMSYYTGTNHLFWYYTLAPCVLIAFVPWVTYAFISQLSPRYALIGTLFSLCFLVLWSTHNHMHGFFFIPRFFQGKALLLMLFVPLTCYLVFLWCRTNLLRYLLATGTAMIACGGVSSTGFYISGIAAGVSVLAFSSWRIQTVIKNLTLLAIVSLPNLTMLIVVKNAIANVEAYSPTLSIEGLNYLSNNLSYLNQIPLSEPVKRPISSMYWLFGDHYSLFIILVLLFSALLFTYTSKSSTRQLSLRWLCLIFILCFSHPLASFLGSTVGPGNLIWRFHWSIPLSLVLGVSAALIIQHSSAFFNFIFSSDLIAKKYSKVLSYTVLLGITALMMVLNSDLLQQKYSTRVSPQKVPSYAMNAASEAVKMTSPNDIIIASYLVAQMLPMLPREATLIASRPLYWQQPYFTSDETMFRKQLQALTDNIQLLTPEQLNDYKTLLKLAGVTVLITTPLSKETEELLSLKALRSLEAYTIYKVTEY